MATTIGKLNVILSAVTSPFQKGLNDARKGVDNFSGGIDGLIKKMSDASFQSRNTANVIKLAFKGGVVGGAMTLAARKMTSALEDVNKVTEQVMRGQISGSDAWAEYTAAISKNIPVAGEFYQLGSSINEMFTHQAAKLSILIERLSAEEEAANRIVANVNELSSKADGSLVSTERSARKAKESLDLLFADPNKKFTMSLDFQLTDTEGQIQAMRDFAKRLRETRGGGTVLGNKAREIERQAQAWETAAQDYRTYANIVRQDTAVADALRDINDQMMRLNGATELDFIIRDLKEMGVSAKEIDKVTAAYNKLAEAQERMDKLNSQISEGVSIADRFLTPIQKYEQQIEAVTAAWKAGKITAEQMEQATAGLNEELDKEINKRDERAKPQDFAQVSLSRIAIGGRVVSPARNDDPKARQIDETNKILRQINSKVGAARAG